MDSDAKEVIIKSSIDLEDWDETSAVLFENVPSNVNYSLKKAILSYSQETRNQNAVRSVLSEGIFLLPGYKKSTFFKHTEKILFLNLQDIIFKKKIYFTLFTTGSEFDLEKYNSKIQEKYKAKKNRIEYNGNEVEVYTWGKKNSTYVFSCELKELCFISKAHKGNFKAIKDFLQESEYGIEYYPILSLNISRFPQKKDYKIAAIVLDRVGWNYAKERSYAWWANAMVGNWNAVGYTQKGKARFTISFFNLQYPYMAKKVHNNYRHEKFKIIRHPLKKYLLEKMFIKVSTPVNLGDKKYGWYQKGLLSEELSFHDRSFVVAINKRVSALGLKKMKSIRKDLQL